MKKQRKQKEEKEQLITILRRPSGLYALINRPKYPFTMSLYHRQHNNSYDELDNFFEATEMALEKVATQMFPAKHKLLHDWMVTDEEQKPNERLCTSFMSLLKNTQEAPDAESVRQSRYKFDPISFLFNCNDRNRMLSETIPGWKLAEDPYWSCNFPGVQKIPKLPANFTLSVLPLLKNESAKTIPDWIWLYRALELDRYVNLLHSISRMLKLGNESFVRAWCRRLLPCAPNRRAIAATLIVHTKLFDCEPTTFSESILADFFTLTSKKNVPSRLFYFLQALKKNVPVHYMFDGFRLSNRYCPEYQFNTFHTTASFEYDIAVQLTNLVRSYIRWTRLPMNLWEEWRKETGFDAIISNLLFFRLGSKVVFHLTNFIVNELYFNASGKTARKYSLIARSVLPDVFAILLEVPRKYRVKFCEGLASLDWEHTVNDFIYYLVPFSKALQRICKSPFDKNEYPFRVLLNFVKNSKHLWPAFLSAPDSSFLALEKSCRSTNNQRLIGRGLRTLLSIAPLFTLKCYRLFPRRLFEVSRLLGVFSYPERNRIVKHFIASPGCSQKFRKLNLFQACEEIQELLTTEISNPAPKILSKYIKGEYVLTPARLKRYRKILFENLNLTRLDILEKSIHQNLTKSFPAANVIGMEHAIQILRLIKNNRRQLKRFLRSYVQGNRLYATDHPRTRDWMRKHPMLNLETWQKGITLSKEIEGFGLIRISLESDPFEVLKMGTYAGSCLGLGGENAFSAAAVMLDINKQVLYARNIEGKVVARQLIAISEDNKLVCFTVYPVRINKSIQQLFGKYDRRFAKTLNVELSRSRSDYEIRKILSQAWYDDSGWNLKV